VRARLARLPGRRRGASAECTLRADHLSCYGYDRPTSPNVDRLARFDPDYHGDFDLSDVPYNPRINPRMPERETQHMIALYDDEIASTDAAVGELRDALDRHGWLGELAGPAGVTIDDLAVDAAEQHPAPALDAETRRELRALGYLGSP